VDPFTDALEICEKDAETLVRLPAEMKQQVFYVLLIRGETLMKENKNPESIDKAVEYFVKAVSLVSSPAEVIMSYEQTLPADIFKRIILALQGDNNRKTREYFAHIAPETGLIRYDECDGPKVSDGASTPNPTVKQWCAVATKSIPKGTVLMSEEADVALLCAQEDYCDFCFKSLEGNDQQDQDLYLSDLKYCSKFCLDQARSSYGKHLENLTGTPAYAYQQLVNVVKETKCYAPLLLLRYISALLEDELRKQDNQETESSSSSKYRLFSHYDYLRPAYRAPRDSDRAESVLIRTILQPSNADIAEFLTDEIYVAMKSTVMFNSIGMADAAACKTELEYVDEAEITQDFTKTASSEIKTSPILKPVEPVRNSGSSSKSKFFGLYHSFSHVLHSFESNCEFVSDENIPRRIKLVAKRDIEADEKLSINYGGSDASKEIIERDFYIKCD
jgi:mitochondrial import receptor subunit TOM20